MLFIFELPQKMEVQSQYSKDDSLLVSLMYTVYNKQKINVHWCGCQHYHSWCELDLNRLKLSPLEHCISRPVRPQHPHSLLWPHWVCSADPGQQSRQQSSSFQWLWSSTLTSLPDTTASKPTTTSFSPRGYTNTPEQVRRTWFIFTTSVCFPTYLNCSAVCVSDLLPSTGSGSVFTYVRWAVMPREQPFAQEVMSDVFSKSGAHVVRFFNPGIFLKRISSV